MHALDTPSLIVGQEFHLRKICFLFPCSLSDCPFKIRFGHKVGKADNRYEVEVFLMGIVDAIYFLLPPEPLKWRHNIIKIPIDLMITFFAHLDCKCDSIEQTNGGLILAVFGVWIALSAYRDIIHRRNCHDRRLVLRQIKFLVFLLIIKSHSQSSFYICSFMYDKGTSIR